MCRSVAPVLIALSLELLLLPGYRTTSTPQLKSIDTMISLDPGDGVLVLETVSNTKMHRLVIESINRNHKINLRDLPKGRRTHLITLPDGDYRWAVVELPGETYRRRHYPYIWELDRDHPHWRFTVTAGFVNYPGTLFLTRFGKNTLSAYTLNRSGEFAARLHEHGRWMIGAFGLTYSGRIRDDFLNFYTERLIDKAREADTEEANATPKR